MATDERNFRSTYYEKVGFKGVEEKKSLEILLKEKPLDKLKLKQFCLRFTVPGVYRNLLWKILLGVIPIYVDSHKFVMSQREQLFRDLERSLKIMRFIDQNTPKSQKFFSMWTIENSKMSYELISQQEHSFLAISQCLIEMFDNDVDIYWLTKGFYNIIVQYQCEIPLSIDKTWFLLEKEDKELYKYLEDKDALKIIPLSNWFQCCFAGVLNESSLAKIWDKLCAGSFKIVVFVAIVLLTTLRRMLLRCNNAESIFQCVGKISEETSEVIVNKAIEVWQQNGCALGLQPDIVLNTKIKS